VARLRCYPSIEEETMSSNKPIKNDDVLLIMQIVQVTGRLGLSMAGAMCRTFVAAQLTMTNAELFDLRALSP
jgi:hypothetical protein